MVKWKLLLSGGENKSLNDSKNKKSYKAEKGGDPRVTMFEQLWYGTAKILTLGPSP